VQHSDGSVQPGVPRSSVVWSALLVLGAVRAAIHIFVSVALDYGYSTDELYFLDSTDRLDWGYVDHPPLCVAVLAAVRWVLGDSLLAVRVVPSMLGGVTVVLGGLLARELGGGRAAQLLSALTALVWPPFLAVCSYYSMNAFDAVFWMLAMLLVLRLLNGARPHAWIGLGVVLGVGFLNKWTVLGFGAGLGVGLLVTPQRRWLATPWPWLAGAITLAFMAPNLLWQVQHDWPTLEFLRNAAATKNTPTTPLSFVLDQIMTAHPLFAPLWIGGLVYLVVAREMRRYRLAAWIWIVFLGLLMSSGAAKSYYASPVYPVLLASGACAVERAAREWGWRWLPAAACAWVLTMGAGASPFALPLLSPPQYVSYQRLLRVPVPKQQLDEVGPLPLHFAVRLHGAAVFEAVSRAWATLSPEDRARAGIFTTSIRQAGAVNLWGPALGMPRAIGNHNSYWLWGPGDASDDPMIVIWPTDRDLGWWFSEVERVADFECPYCIASLGREAVYLARRPRRPLAEVWHQLKDYR
jgi:hypothetical protein